MILVVLCIIIVLYVKFMPKLDKLPTGETIVWYSSGGKYDKNKRDYIIIKKE